MIRRILALFRKPPPEPEPVDDFLDVLEDLWADREARRNEELRRAIQFDLECDK